MAALQAEPQMDPAIAGLNAVFADIAIGGFEFDLLQVTTALGHGFLLSQSTNLQKRN